MKEDLIFKKINMDEAFGKLDFDNEFPFMENMPDASEDDFSMEGFYQVKVAMIDGKVANAEIDGRAFDKKQWMEELEGSIYLQYPDTVSFEIENMEDVKQFNQIEDEMER